MFVIEFITFRLKTEEIDWISIATFDIAKIWTPQLRVLNGIYLQTRKAFGKFSKNLDSFWYYYPEKKMVLKEFVNLKVACNQSFTNFPFDEHICDINFRSFNGLESVIIFRNMQLVDDTSSERLRFVKILKR